MVNKVIDTINKYNLISKDDKIVVGVSGGPDSMALLHILKSLGYSVCVAHINHGLRENAHHEEEYVRQFCEERDIPFFVKHINNYVQRYNFFLIYVDFEQKKDTKDFSVLIIIFYKYLFLFYRCNYH